MLINYKFSFNENPTSFQSFTDSTDCHKLIANNSALIFFKFFA